MASLAPARARVESDFVATEHVRANSRACRRLIEASRSGGRARSTGRSLSRAFGLGGTRRQIKINGKSLLSRVEISSPLRAPTCAQSKTFGAIASSLKSIVSNGADEHNAQLDTKKRPKKPLLVCQIIPRRELACQWEVDTCETVARERRGHQARDRNFLLCAKWTLAWGELLLARPAL